MRDDDAVREGKRKVIADITVWNPDRQEDCTITIDVCADVYEELERRFQSVDTAYIYSRNFCDKTMAVSGEGMLFNRLVLYGHIWSGRKPPEVLILDGIKKIWDIKVDNGNDNTQIDASEDGG